MLTVDGLTANAAARSRVPLLRGVSFSVAAGERLAIVGASGSGKSLTGRALIALPPAGVTFGGRVLFEGQDLLTRSERVLEGMRGRRVAMIFQEPATALNPVKRIGAQIAEPLAIHGSAGPRERRSRAAALLERTGLARAGVGPERYPHELSGGQRQRVAVAIALALAPRLVIADEPTSALDAVAAGKILDLLVTLTAEEGAALVLITHDLALARRADRVAVMDNGAIAEEGAAGAVLSAPRSAAGRTLAASRRITLPPRPAPGRTAMPAVLSAERIVVVRSGKRLVDVVSFHVAPGERVALVGGSGAGKTTLVRALLGLVPRQGAVAVDGVPVARPDDPRLRAAAQMVFQDPATSFNPRHSVRRIVTEPLYRSGLTRAQRTARGSEALARVGLSEAIFPRRPHAFSGGQRQRIAIARALVASPRVLVADEAVSALDAALRADVIHLLDRLTREEGIALVFIAHDLALVRLLADRIAVMDDGCVVEVGTPTEIFETPRHPATRALVELADQTV